MSEKIRRINKKPFLKRIQVPQKTGTFFLVGCLLVSTGAYLVYKSTGNISRKQATFVAGPSVQPGEIKDKNLMATICRGENCFWVNRNGVAFGQSGRTGGNLVLSFDDKTSRILETGLELIKPESLAELLFLRKKFSDELNVALKEGETNDLILEDFSFKTGEGWTLKLTLAENAYRSVEVLRKALEETKKTAPSEVAGLDYMDLRIPNKVFYKFK